jgi:hypothetical protein
MKVRKERPPSPIHKKENKNLKRARKKKKEKYVRISDTNKVNSS